ncbi:MAG TPA: hypothetical protein VIW80_16260 [Pyrinomonadaceae bacterium]
MRSSVRERLRLLPGLALGLMLMAVNAGAQQPSPSPKTSAEDKTVSSTQTGEEAGDYTIVSSLEFGYRGLSVVGDHNKYRSDLNYKAGPRLFDSSFLMRAKEGKTGGLFDTLLVNSTGWGADPYGHVRISAEKSSWYRFDGNYRRFKYFNFLNNIANPNYATRPTDPVTGQHGYDTRQQMGDFDLTILPKNRQIRFTVGYSPERYSGPAFTTYHFGGDDFMLLSETRSRANNYRFGLDARLGPVDISFLQGFRRFRDDSFIDTTDRNLGVNPALTNFLLTSFRRNQPARGHINFTRFSAHTFLARKLDVTARIIYTSSTSDVDFVEAFTGANFNTRVTGVPTANILNLGTYSFEADTKRPQTLGDLGITYMATDKLRISDTFRVETFQISGGSLYSSAFFLTRTNGAPVPPILANGNLVTNRITKYRKLQNTIEADYQFNDRYSIHFGYRYGSRHIEEFYNGFNPGAIVPALVVPVADEETNHTNTFFGGFRARPLKNWTIYFDAERGAADNVFTRLGNYDYTHVRARSRYAPTRTLSFNVSVITRDNSNPSEIAGVSLQDFGVDIKSRVFTSTVSWTPNSKLSFNAGYNYNWVESDAVVNYFFNNVQHPEGHSLYFMRNNFFFFDTVAQLHPRVTLYAAYRINKDTGQGDRRADPTGTPGFLITSYPMSYQSPEARVAVRLNRWLDWNVGYQYYNYRESPLITVRPQNYHAHLPYVSLRIYFGRGRG